VGSAPTAISTSAATARSRLGSATVGGDTAVGVDGLAFPPGPGVGSDAVEDGFVPAITPDFDGFAALHPWAGAKVGVPEPLTGGFRQQFEHVMAYGAFGASADDVHEIHGPIRTKFDSMANPDGFLLLGYPLTDEVTLPDSVG